MNPATRRWGIAAAVVAVVAVVAAAMTYVGLVFAPRERARVASPELADLLAADTRFERVLWIASPHQNLGALDERVGDLALYLAELTRLAGISPPRLPTFGPFSLPPARELALAWSGSGQSFLGVARIEPGVGLVARIAGRLAGNPWLAGGRVETAGRTIEVRWQGGLWIVASGLPADLTWPLPRSEEAVRRAAEPAAIAQLVLRRPAGQLPAGRFVLARGVAGLEVRSGVLPETLQPASDGSFPGIALWVSSTDRGPIGGPGLFLLWDSAAEAIPRVAVLQRGGGRTFKLPGESLLHLVGEGEPAYRLGWSVRATQSSARREALLLVPWFERHLPRPGSRTAWLGLAGRLVPATSARTLERLARNLELLPLLPALEVRRLAAGAHLLAPFRDCAAITFEVWHEPEGARLRLCTRLSGPEAMKEGLSSGEDGEIDEEVSIR